MTWNFRCGLVAVLAIVAAPLLAADLPPIAFLSMGFQEVRLGDLRDSPQMKIRAAFPSGYLSVTADFNGDGKADEARILQNRDRRIAYVVAVIASSDKVDTYVLSQLPISGVANVGIEAVGPWRDLTGGKMLNGLAIVDLTTGKGEASFLAGEEFDIRLPFDLFASAKKVAQSTTGRSPSRL